MTFFRQGAGELGSASAGALINTLGQEADMQRTPDAAFCLGVTHKLNPAAKLIWIGNPQPRVLEAALVGSFARPMPNPESIKIHV